MDVAFHREIALADLAARIGAIEHGIMFFLQERRAFQRHRAANMDIGRFDILLGEAQNRQHFKREIVELLICQLQHILAKIFAQRPFVERELDIEGALESRIQGFDLLVGKALRLQRRRIDARRLIEIAMADGISLNLRDLAFRIAKRAQRFRHGAVDDLEIAAASKLLELHQCEVWLDTGRIAIHDEANRAGRCDDGGLRIAVAVLFAKLQRLVPGRTGMGDEVLIRAILSNQRHRIDGKTFIALTFAMGGAAMVADNAQHMLGIRLIAWEGSKLLRHFGGCGIGHAGHDRRQRTADSAAFFGVIGNAGGHQQAANIGIAKAERAVFIGEAAISLDGNCAIITEISRTMVQRRAVCS